MCLCAVEIEHNKDKGGDDSGEGSEKVRVGYEEESFELVVFVGANGHAFSLFYKVEAGFKILYLELIDSLFFRSMELSQICTSRTFH